MVENVPKKVNATSVDVPTAFDRRRVSNLLPSINRTDIIKKFFAGVTDHLFQPEQSQKLDGFIGRATSYTNYSQEFYLGEPNSDRQVYQLEPTQISRDENGDITDTLFYSDLPNLIRLQGGLSENHSRLFDTETYSWAPPVDLDKLMNFINYFWNDSSSDPDYIVMERGAINSNPWSTGNHWVHRDDLDPEMSMEDANARQATRPIICFLRDLELYSYGTIDAGTVTVRDNTTQDPRSELNGQPNPVVDGRVIQDGDTVVLTNVSNTLANYSFTTQTATDILMQNVGSTGIITWMEQIVFDNLNFYVGATIKIENSSQNDGIYVIQNIDSLSRTITVDNTFTATGYQNVGVKITEQVSAFSMGIYQFVEISSSGIFDLMPFQSVEDGSIAAVEYGNQFGGKTIFYDGVQDEWIDAQTKTNINQSPLFQLYDGEGVKLQDSGKYPGSNFSGSKLFGYQINSDDRQPIDTVLGIPLYFDNQGDIVYENYIVTERYSWNAPKEEILGYYYHKTDNGETIEYGNDWYLKSERSMQRISDRFIASNDDVKTFTLSVAPDPIDSIRVYVNEVEKIPSVGDSWNVTGKDIEFDLFFQTTDRLRISYASVTALPSTASGKYEIPVNLEANPDNLEVDFISNSQWFEHFTTIIRNQDGFEGAPRGVNNWHTLEEKDYSLGEKILQHRAPMLKTMMLGANQDIDFAKSVRYVGREYSRFRNKLIRKLELYINDGIHTESQGALKWLEDAMRDLNLGKTTDFPFAYSGMFSLPSTQTPYMPSSPSRLGVYPVYTPSKFFDLTYVGSNQSGQTTTFGREVIQFHDGSVMIAFGDFRDDILLEMENRIYETIPDEYKIVTERPDFDLVNYVESAFRDGDYTISEFNRVLLPIVQRWAIDKGLDPFKNTTYELSNPFTYNYSSQGLPGYWRGIYKWFLDTDRPNTHPWEMFGYTQIPTGWTTTYGFAPYTYNPGTSDPNEQKHLLLWQDVSVGLDRFRSGTINEKYARPGINPPVDASGNLLNPIAWGVATDPGVDGSNDWRIGDHGPVETVFRRSEQWPFAVAQLSYLMKPVRFIELGWEPRLQTYQYADGANPQWVDLSTNDRKHSSEYQVHGEVIDGVRYLSDGISQWVSEYIVSQGRDITSTFGNKIRGLEVVLGHRAAGFINQNATRVLTDNFGLVPAENLNILTYLNPCVREEVYTGVIIKRVPEGWEIQGYDVLDPVFRIIPPMKTGRKTNVDVGSIRVIQYLQYANYIEEVPYGTIYDNQQDLYEFLLSLGQYQKSKGWIFDEVDLSTNAVNDWKLAGRQFLFWTLGNWADGSLIALSPLAQNVKYATQQGTILNIERIVNGVYGILNREGSIIDPRDTFVSRLEEQVSIVPEEFEAIFSARIIVAEYEHVMLFDNVTDFNDLMYDPLLSLRQPRLRLSTTRAGDWRGRIDAPGYIIQSGNILPNYDKMVSDFVKYFNIEDPVERPILQEAARNLIGYQERSYFGDLLISDVSQIQFYQGFIRTKGTSIAIDRLLRSNEAVNVDELTVYEEWALRVGEFGGVQDQTQIEFYLRDSEWKGQPQLVEFRGSVLSQPLLANDLVIYLDDVRQLPDQGTVIIEGEEIFYNQKDSTSKTLIVPSLDQRRINQTPSVDYPSETFVGLADDKIDDVITIANNDDRWNIRPPKDGTANFPVRDFRLAQRDKNANYYFRDDLKRSGYPLENEVKHRVSNISNMENIDFLSEKYFEGDRIWVDNIGNYYEVDDPRSFFNNGFMVYRYSRYVQISEIDRRFLDYVRDPDSFSGDENIVLVKTKEPHNLKNNDLIVINGVETIFGNMNGSYRIDTASLNDSENQFLIYTTLSLDENSISGLTFEKTVYNLSLVCGSDVAKLEYEFGMPGRIITPENLKEHGFIEGRTIRLSGTDFQDGEYTIDCFETRRVPNDTIKLVQQFPNVSEVGPISSPITIEQSNLKYIGRNTIELLDGSSFDDLQISNRFIRLRNSSGNDQTYTIKSINGTLLNVIEEFPGNIGFEYSESVILSDSIGGSSATLDIFHENRFRDFISLENETLPNGTSVIRLGGEYAYVDNKPPVPNEPPLWGVYQFARDDFIGDGFTTTFMLRRELKPGEILIAKACGRDDSLPPFSLDGTSIIFSQAPKQFWDPFYFEGWNSNPWNSITWNGQIQGCYWDSEAWDADKFPITICYSQPWDLVRIQPTQIDTELFRQSVLYDNNTKVIDVFLNIWDPVKNQFPGQLLNEITYKTEYNPAKFNIISSYEQDDAEENGFNYDELLTDQSLQNIYGLDPKIAWGDEKVGQLWWDVSQAEYVNYEDGTNRERRDNWGRLAQGRAIRIYEWVRSPVPPAQWADYVQANVGQPEESFQGDKPSGIALQDSDGEYRYTRIIKRDAKTGQNKTTYYFWVTDKETIPEVQGRSMAVTVLQRKMANPTLEGLPWWAPINDDAIIISNVGDTLTEEDSIFQLNYNVVQNPNDAHREWVMSRENDPNDVPSDRYWNKMVDSLVGFDRLNQIVPDPKLETGRRYGNFIRPRQTWFVDSVAAGKVFIDKLNELMSAECVVDTRIGILDELSVHSAEPTLYTGGFTIQSGVRIYPSNRAPDQYDRHVTSITERNQLLDLGHYEQVWVDGTIATDNFFKVFQYQPNGTWIEVFSETYKLSDFWSTSTYYEDGYDETLVASIEVDTITDRNNIPLTLLFDGFVARVADSNSDGSNVAAFYEYDSTLIDPWVLVAKEGCIIEFDRNLFFDTTYGNPNLDTGFTGSQLALKALLVALRSTILTDLEENQLMYTMIRYVQSEQHVVDWAFKTSYVLITGYNEEARQDPIQRKSQTESFIEFFNEAKPYHTKLRDFITNVNVGSDTYNTDLTDFDKPVYYDFDAGEYRVLNDTVPADQDILSDPNSKQNSWFRNYIDNPELIRTVNTTIVFDRVSCNIDGGWDSNGGWDNSINNSWDVNFDDVLHDTAANRIWNYYVPGPLTTQDAQNGNVTVHKNLSDLIPGCRYRGVTVDGNLEIINGIQFIDEFQANGVQKRFRLSRELLAAEHVEIKICGKNVPQSLSQSSWNSAPWNSTAWSQTSEQIWYLDGRDIVFNIPPNSMLSPFVNSWDGDCAWDEEPWDGDLTIQACVIAVNLIDLNQIDTWINPNNNDYTFTDPSQTLLENSIIIDGYLFRQPDYDSGHADEQIIPSIGESISITVGTQEAPGAPKMVTRKYIGQGPGASYDIGQRPGSVDSIFVFINGARVDQSNFTIDSDMLQIDADSLDDIAIVSFSAGGAVISEGMQIFMGNGTNTDFTLSNGAPISASAIFVVVAGQPQTLGVDYDVVGDQLQFVSAPADMAEIVTYAFESELFTRIYTNEFTVTNTINNRFVIGQNLLSINPVNPLSTDIATKMPVPSFVDNVFVEVNGARQIGYDSANPLDDFDYLIDFAPINHEMVFVTKLKLALIGSLIPGNQFKISNGNPSTAVTVTISGTDILTLMNDIQTVLTTAINIVPTYDDIEIDTINLVNITGGMIEIEDISGSPISSTFGYTGTDKTANRSLNEDDVITITTFSNDYTIFYKTYDGSTPAFIVDIAHDLVSASQVEIRLNGTFLGNIDYMVDISQNQIAINNLSGVVIGDQFEIFVYYIGTETFEGSVSGEYILGQKQVDPELAIVYYNGLRQDLNIDYAFVNDGTKLVFNDGHDETDTVILTGFTGRPMAEGIAFRVFLDNVSAIEYQKRSKPVAVSSVAETVIGSTIKLKYNTGFGLATSINAVGKMIVIDVSGSTSPVTGWDMLSDAYGIINGNDLNTDLIEYTNVVLTEDNCLTVDIVSRTGTNTSRIISENDIVVVIDEIVDYLPNWQAHRISDEFKVNLAADLKLSDTEIQIDRVAGLPKQKPGQVRMDIPGVIWIGSERIEYYERDGTTLKQIRRGTGGTSVGIPAEYDTDGNLISDWRTVTDFVYPAGTQIIDGSKRQEIPGGYRFDATGFGLQYTNSLMGRFLQDKPGTC